MNIQYIRTSNNDVRYIRGFVSQNNFYRLPIIFYYSLYQPLFLS